MRLRHIEIFHAIYTTGSVTNAAKLLHVSQPSVSKVLSHAELQLGFQLFDRVKGRLVPTNEATLLFENVDQIYRQLNTINDAAENIKNKEIGRVSLALTPALGFDIVPSTVASFRRRRPKIRFDIQTLHNEQVFKHLQRHKSEFAVLFAPEKLSGVSEIEFAEGKLVAVYPKSMLPHCPVQLSLSELIQYPLISIRNSGPLADIIWQEVQVQNLNLSDAIKVQTYFIAVNLVKHGTGVCIVDEFTAKGQLSDEIGIAQLSEDLNFPIKGLFLENRPLSHATLEFIEVLKHQLSQFQS